MKKNCLSATLLLAVALDSHAQPRPFEPDPTFVPTVEFMQKRWAGSYDGVEPNSRMILSLNRTLVLNTDLTYVNTVTARVSQQTDETLLKYESGTYRYNAEERTIDLCLLRDSTLDINILLRGDEPVYEVNVYDDEAQANTFSEAVLFTLAQTDAERKWILFDPLLMSAVDPRQKAVYTMAGIDIVDTSVAAAHPRGRTQADMYDLSGIARKHAAATRAVRVYNGRKIISK